MGEELGVTDRAVSKWENGKSFPDPTISLIKGNGKIIPGHQSDRATVSDTGYQCQ